MKILFGFDLNTNSDFRWRKRIYNCSKWIKARTNEFDVVE